MRTRLIVRLIDAAGQLLGWTEAPVVARGDGQLWSQDTIVLLPDVSGLPAIVSVHWCDVHVETRTAWPSDQPVAAGRVVQVFRAGTPVLRVGEPPVVGLPPVTVRAPVAVTVPAGGLGIVAS